MPPSFTRLPSRSQHQTIGLMRPACVLPERVTLDSPALDSMTDFSRVTAFIATPGDTIAQAEERMHRRKVKLLFVMDDQDRMIGLVTSTDIHGEKPMQVVQSRGIRRDEILVADIMTPADHIEAVDYDDLAHARVGHILETLKASGRQHALVIEQNGNGTKVRGLLSLTMLSKQLGVTMHATEVARTFHEIEQQLAHV